MSQIQNQPTGRYPSLGPQPPLAGHHLDTDWHQVASWWYAIHGTSVKRTGLTPVILARMIRAASVPFSALALVHALSPPPPE